MSETKRDLHADLALCEKAERWDFRYVESVTDANFAKFIATAREGWPHAIERAIAAENRVMVAEAENTEIRADLLQSSRTLYEAQRYIDELEAEVKRAYNNGFAMAKFDCTSELLNAENDPRELIDQWCEVSKRLNSGGVSE